MENTLPSIAKELLQIYNYPVVIAEILKNISCNNISTGVTNEIIKRSNYDIEDYYIAASIVICHYALIILDDHIIEDNEITNITLLKSALNIGGINLYTSDTAELIESIFAAQMKWIYSDKTISFDEQVYIDQMQNMFNMSFDDCEQIVAKLKEK